MRMMSMVSMALIVSLGSVAAGGCSPGARPYGIGAGGVLAVAGGMLVASAAGTDCGPESTDPILGGLELAAAGVCEGGKAGGITLGAVTGLTGLAIMMAALASSSGSEAAPLPAPPLQPTPAPAAAPAAYPWVATPPSPSPSAPSGASLSIR